MMNTMGSLKHLSFASFARVKHRTKLLRKAVILDPLNGLPTPNDLANCQ